MITTLAITIMTYIILRALISVLTEAMDPSNKVGRVLYKIVDFGFIIALLITLLFY